jgi:hypothetical protein
VGQARCGGAGAAVSGLGRAAAAARRAAARLVPAGRREWVEAVWAEACEVPPGLRRLAWRAGGVRLLAREALRRRAIGGAMLFAVAAALVAWAAWAGSPAYLAASDYRAEVIAMVVLLAGLPLLTRWLFGPAGDSRAARFLRVGTYAAILALIPARNVVDQVRDMAPRGGSDLRVYRLVDQGASNRPWLAGILLLVLMALYAAAVLWMTSQRSRVAPATLAAGTGAGIVVGVVVYAVAPLGLSKAATNPWLPGSDIDPLVLLAWLLVLFGPVAAAVVADRRYTASGSWLVGARVRQILAAGLLTSTAGALLAAVLGTGTTAAMLKAAWLRTWLYHGDHLLYGVQGLSSDLRTLPAIAYGHELTAAVDASAFLLMCIAFPLIALALTGFGALSVLDNVPPGQGDPPSGGGPSGPQAVPDPPDGARWPAVPTTPACLSLQPEGALEPDALALD